MGHGGAPITTASELAEYTYCRRSWWLTHVQGLPSASQAAFKHGRLLHAEHGRLARRAAWLGRLAAAAILAGLLVAAAGFYLLLTAAGAGP